MAVFEPLPHAGLTPLGRSAARRAQRAMSENNFEAALHAAVAVAAIEPGAPSLRVLASVVLGVVRQLKLAAVSPELEAAMRSDTADFSAVGSIVSSHRCSSLIGYIRPPDDATHGSDFTDAEVARNIAMEIVRELNLANQRVTATIKKHSIAISVALRASIASIDAIKALLDSNSAPYGATALSEGFDGHPTATLTFDVMDTSVEPFYDLFKTVQTIDPGASVIVNGTSISNPNVAKALLEEFLREST